MYKADQPPPGFVMPPTAPSGPQQQGYPPPYQPFPAPIQHQPGFGGQQQQPQANNWASTSNFHGYLRTATSFHVKQKVELLESLVGWETPNKYTVKDQTGNKLFYVGEESGCCPRQLCASRRPFTLTTKDSQGNNILVFDRGLNCTCCCGLFCPDSLSVSTPNGQLLGTVKEGCNILYPTFDLKDAFGNTQLKIEGPMCPVAFGRCGPAVFRVMNLSGVSVGTISKEWSGFVRELFTDADYFSMSFPMDLDPAMKAVALGALFLIDFQYFEQGTMGGQGGRRLFG